jgi:hypothetical protein
MKRCGGLRRQSGPEGENFGARGRQPINEQRRGAYGNLAELAQIQESGCAGGEA